MTASAASHDATPATATATHDGVSQTPLKVYTTSNGCPVGKPESSLRASNMLLLRDFHLIDLLSHLNRERIPERVVHARGAGAYGEFEVCMYLSFV